MSAPASPDATPPAVLAVLRRPGVATTFLLSLVARLPGGAVAALLALKIGPVHGYAAAGIVDAAFAITMAIAVPFWARLMERAGPTLILGALSIANGCVLVAAGVLPASTSPVLFGALAVLGGATEPLFGGAMRGLWDQLLDTDAERHVGYSLESGALEAVFAIATAIYVGLIAALAGPGAALIAAGATIMLAGACFATTRAVRAWAGQDDDTRTGGVLGALARPGARTVAAVSVAAGLYVGPVEIGLTAFSTERDSPALLGVLLTVWALGSMVAGFLFARVAPAEDPRRRMILLLCWLAGMSLVLGLVRGPVLLGIVLVISGAGLAPFFATLNGSFERLAPGEAVAELYGLSFSGVLVGSMLGAPLAGVLIDHVSANAALGASALGPLLGAVLLVTRRRDFQPAQ